MSVADRLEPLYEAVIVTDCEKTTIDVFTVKVTLVAPAGTVTLSSSNPSVASVPASVTVPAGATSVTFTVNTSIVVFSQSVTITASYNGSSRSATLIVQLLL